ncbi:MAG: DNA repair protein RecN [Oscillospiraceae bacterium]|nr:DNA repair protein RecN [Oscillospiraceae bacterium]
MLKELHIENLAVIEKATIELGDKLNVFTGETGAGKSILIGGINAVLGQRISKDIVRTGTDKAFVTAVFSDIPNSVIGKLSELGFACDDELIISREISADGRSSARINSRPVNVSSIKELGEMLVNIHGQHDSQVLLNPDKHLSVLDNFAESQELLTDYQSSFKELQNVAREMKRVSIDEQQKAQRVAYLESIVNDIGSLEIEKGEDEAVEEKFRFADNAVSLSQAVKTALNCLSGDDNGSGAGDLIARAYTELEINDDIMPSLKPINERLSNLGIELGDLTNELTKLLSSLDIDEAEYARLSERRVVLNRIKKRFGPTLDDVIKVYEDSAEELAQLSSSQEVLAQLSKQRSELLLEVTKKAQKLSEFRKNAAVRFKESVCNELSFLNMPDVRIEVKFETGKLTLAGMDSVEFLISANAGEIPKPLAKIASGGELSRIMLALKTVLADRDDIPTLIFDEIDAGVSGRAAQKIGTKLRQISRSRQVICVTHLAQIAITGDDHILIEKNNRLGRTVTEIKKLSFDERKLEIARILGGDNITETVLKDAEEQLLLAQK